MTKVTDDEYVQNLDDARLGLKWGVFFHSSKDENICVAIFLNECDARSSCVRFCEEKYMTYFVAEAGETFRLKRNEQ